MDFDTGKLLDVAEHDRPDRRREYRLLTAIVIVACVPWLIGLYFYPLATAIIYLFAGYFQVLLSFATSSGSDTSHHIRFLLSGSNPVGMTGASSLLLGAVDFVADWTEDRRERRQNWFRYWALGLYKLCMTPVGMLLMLAEFAWDVVLMRRPGLPRLKWQELFAVAWYHSLVCPEKSNDIFYADLAFARFRGDVYLYQWHRLRAMVFELEHYRIDVDHGLGEPSTNLFRQTQLAAFATIRRLQLVRIESKLAAWYQDHMDLFPVPSSLAEILLKNARPVGHYLRMRQQMVNDGKLVTDPVGGPFDFALAEMQKRRVYLMWIMLQVMEHTSVSSNLISHVHADDWRTLVDVSWLRRLGDQYELSESFRDALTAWLEADFREITDAEAEEARLAVVPCILLYDGRTFVPSKAEGGVA